MVVVIIEGRFNKMNKINNKVICDFCLFIVNRGKSIKCSVCSKRFCKSCLVQFGEQEFFCVSCSINVLRENTKLLIFNDKKISSKNKLKLPNKEIIKNEKN